MTLKQNLAFYVVVLMVIGLAVVSLPPKSEAISSPSPTANLGPVASFSVDAFAYATDLNQF